MGEEIRLLSVNINGLNSPNKRKKIFNKLIKARLNIICLQEVHVKRDHLYLLNYTKLGQLYTSLADTKKRGVAIYVQKHINSRLIFADDEGRLVMIEVEIGGKKCILVCIYAPNGNQKAFFQNLYSKLVEFDYSHICVVGDFNAIDDKDKDYISGNKNQEGKKRSVKKRLPTICHQIQEEFGLKDIWREKHPEDRQYTYFSARHSSWSRIDAVWMSGELRQGTQKVEIGINEWADHNPLWITWGGLKTRPRWRMDVRVLKDEQFLSHLKKEMSFFFQENNKEDANFLNVWETAKAVFRGLVINYIAGKRKKERARRDKLIEDLTKSEAMLQQDPNNRELNMNLKLVRHQINLLDQEDLEKKLRWMKQRQFENANKQGRWLTYRLKKEKERSRIHNLREGNGEWITGEEGKKKIAQEFYSDLYRKEDKSEQEIKKYLEESDLPKIPDISREILDREITEGEIERVMGKQKTGKTPGTDGLPIEYYKALWEVLSPYMTELFNRVIQEGQIPNSWSEALITLLPKEGSDLSLIQNYRPISLLNADYKLFAAVLAERLKGFLNQFIHEDQNGFLPGRQIRDNVRIIMNVLEYYETHIDKQLALVFVDAQKAFDRVSWSFLVGLLQHMQFGERFIQAIRSIYSKQSAKILINGDVSEQICIEKGTRQGCPLSPLLFILSLEPLLRGIRRNLEIKGLHIKNQQYKIQAYADDLVFILEDPTLSGPNLINELGKYGNVAGLKINKEKTKVITKNLTTKQGKELEANLGFQIVNKLRYLGIILSAKCTTIKEDNYLKLLHRTEQDLEKWKNLQTSLLGRIAIIKSYILPKWTYLFYTAPARLDNTFFKKLNQCVLKFIWQNKKPRIKLKMLQELKERGGFGLPKWEYYYQAANLVWVREWILLRRRRLLILEGSGLQQGWHHFLWQDKVKKYMSFAGHYVRNILIDTWKKVKGKFYSATPSWLVPLEAITYSSLYNREKHLSYRELLDAHGCLKTRIELELQGIKLDWWSYAQISSKYKKDKEKSGIDMTQQEIDGIILGKEERILSKIYKFLITYWIGDEIVKDSMIAWGRNIGYSIELIKWEEIWTKQLKFLMATSYKENLYKMVYRWHLPPARLAKMFSGLSPSCWKCGEIGTYYHVWWTCPKAIEFWRFIQRWILEITGYKLQLKPEYYLLNIRPDKIGTNIWCLITYITTAARICFAQYWKGKDLPAEDLILGKIIEYAEADRLTKILRDQKDSVYFQCWDQWYIWLNNRIKNG